MSFKNIAVASVLALATVAMPVASFAKMTGPDMKMLDPDSDGTISLDEAQKAGAMKFDALDPDKDGTLDIKEAKGLMTKVAFKMTDPDKDGTIDKAEYAAAIEAAFKKADTDGEGTVDAKELKTAAGKKLLALIQ